MTLVKCSDCEHEISKKAKTCPNCGAKNKQPSIFLRSVVVLFLLAIIAQIFSGTSNAPKSQNHRTSSNTAAITPLPESRPQQKSLEVLSFSCDTEHGYMFIRGEVKNITEAPIENLMAIATFRTKDGTFVKSDDALVEYNPLLPGQTSPFKVGTSENPASEKCGLGFKIMFGSALSYK